MTFGVTVVCSNNLEMLKVTESILSKLYKTTVYSVDLGMFRVQASMAVPQDYSQEKLFEFGLNDKKEFNVTFDIEVQSFVPVFENGILLTEIDDLIRKADCDADGIGMIRSNGAGELGVQFGGIFQKFEYTVDNIKKAPIEGTVSNKGYINPDEIRTGDQYLAADIDSAPIQPESPDSKAYRNAEDNEG
jgi:hypothetical protein